MRRLQGGQQLECGDGSCGSSTGGSDCSRGKSSRRSSNSRCSGRELGATHNSRGRPRRSPCAAGAVNFFTTAVVLLVVGSGCTFADAAAAGAGARRLRRGGRSTPMPSASGRMPGAGAENYLGGQPSYYGEDRARDGAPYDDRFGSIERWIHANTKNKPITPNDIRWPQEGPYAAYRPMEPAAVLPKSSLIPHTKDGDYRVPYPVKNGPAHLPVMYYQPGAALKAQSMMYAMSFNPGLANLGLRANVYPVNEQMLWKEWKKPGSNYLAFDLPQHYTPGLEEPGRWLTGRGAQGVAPPGAPSQYPAAVPAA